MMQHSDLVEKAEKLIERHGGVRKAARALGVNHGVLSLARAGHDFPKARQVLGLPPKAIAVSPCPQCGKVHAQLKQCDDRRRQDSRNGKRHRLHYELGRGEAGRQRLAELRREMQVAGCQNFTEWVDQLRNTAHERRNSE